MFFSNQKAGEDVLFSSSPAFEVNASYVVLCLSVYPLMFIVVCEYLRLEQDDGRLHVVAHSYLM